jgi:tRNA dimethylallyltransferase
MTHAFFIVGPTASGKSQVAADIAGEIDAEIVSADAFQLYRGLNLLTAKPDPLLLAQAPHHMIGTVPITEEMNAEKYRRAAAAAIAEINSRGKRALVVGGTGLYVKALTHGLASLPESDPKIREKLNTMSLDELGGQLAAVDPATAQRTDLNNRRRVTRALEICLLTGKPTSHVLGTAGPFGAARAQANNRGWTGSSRTAAGVFVFRDREELYNRINQRVEAMFEHGVVDEVRTVGATSATASQMIGLREIRELIAGNKDVSRCIAEIQQATRRYAKRQLTWFRRQTNFLPLNLSFLSHKEAVKWISLRILSEAPKRDD